MSWYVTQSIGGTATPEQVAELFGIAADAGLLVESHDVHAETVIEQDGLDDALTFLDADGTLSFNAPEHQHPRFKRLEDACRRIGLPFDVRIDGDGESTGQSRWWRSGMEQEGSCAVDADHNAVLTVQEIVEARTAGGLDALIERSTKPELTGFKIVY